MIRMMSRMVPSDMINLSNPCAVEACINAQCTIGFRKLRSKIGRRVDWSSPQLSVGSREQVARIESRSEIHALRFNQIRTKKRARSCASMVQERDENDDRNWHAQQTGE